MFYKSRRALFYKSNQSKALSHPLRRWVPHYMLGGALCFSGAMLGYRYCQALREAKQLGDAAGNHLCSPGVVDFFTLLPFNVCSHAMGVVAGDALLGQSTHQRLISWIAWLYRIPMEESDTVSFSTLQEFYTRMWKAECRPIHSTAHLISPCDGEVLSVMEDVKDSALLQIKGCQYSVQSLFRLTSVAPPPSDAKRVLVVLKMGMRDFHHVVSPRDFHCHGSIYVPGCLMPISKAWYHYIPGVLTLNERVVVHGTSSGHSVFVALVGSTLTGKIKLAFDKLVNTNFLDPPEYAVFSKYDSLHLRKGTLLGTFEWGSAVALLADISTKENLVVKAGATVKAGEPLVA